MEAEIKLYLLSFKLANDNRYPDRYDDLVQTLKASATSGVWWSDAKSLILFESDHNLQSITDACKSVIDLSKDFLLITTGIEQGRLIGLETVGAATGLPFCIKRG